MKGWVTAFCVAHIVQAAFIISTLWNYNFVTASPEPTGRIYALIGQQIPAGTIDQAIKNPNALQVAYDVGVLELLSIGLTLFAILLAIVAFLGFWMIRSAALKAAADAAAPEAQDVAAKIAKHVAQEWIEKNAPEIFNQALKARGLSDGVDVALTTAEQNAIIAKASEIKADG
ncbi:hypothetical protein GFL85_24645 [Rhizobium laguerreae]|uniref:hypothetical protein n=1 Tax=Rhizobium laguerreae TaxID=1076926 RepID=UPI00143F4C77|nr:hypothetical protein [Rhizobium laguerreae]NKM14170.1 hypothetical protein [Rhizobium laguerreae]